MEVAKHDSNFVKMQMVNWCTFERFKDIQEERFIHPELMNYVPISHKWKQFICHMGRARDRYSIAEAGLVAGGKEGKEGRQTNFLHTS